MRLFICHASEDKSNVAGPLAERLASEGHEVWYDEYALTLGDSLSGEIDKGLAQCDFGVVILSPAFFAKRWPQRELAGLVARETSGNPPRKLILPVWHLLGADEIRVFSPTLADRVAVSTEDGLSTVVSAILRAIEAEIGPGEDSIFPRGGLPDPRVLRVFADSIERSSAIFLRVRTEPERLATPEGLEAIRSAGPYMIVADVAMFQWHLLLCDNKGGDIGVVECPIDGIYENDYASTLMTLLPLVDPLSLEEQTGGPHPQTILGSEFDRVGDDQGIFFVKVPIK